MPPASAGVHCPRHRGGTGCGGRTTASAAASAAPAPGEATEAAAPTTNECSKPTISPSTANVAIAEGATPLGGCVASATDGAPAAGSAGLSRAICSLPTEDVSGIFVGNVELFNEDTDAAASPTPATTTPTAAPTPTTAAAAAIIVSTAIFATASSPPAAAVVGDSRLCVGEDAAAAAAVMPAPTATTDAVITTSPPYPTSAGSLDDVVVVEDGFDLHNLLLSTSGGPAPDGHLIDAVSRYVASTTTILDPTVSQLLVRDMQDAAVASRPGMSSALRAAGIRSADSGCSTLDCLALVASTLPVLRSLAEGGGDDPKKAQSIISSWIDRGVVTTRQAEQLGLAEIRCVASRSIQAKLEERLELEAEEMAKAVALRKEEEEEEKEERIRREEKRIRRKEERVRIRYQENRAKAAKK